MGSGGSVQSLREFRSCFVLYLLSPRQRPPCGFGNSHEVVTSGDRFPRLSFKGFPRITGNRAAITGRVLVLVAKHGENQVHRIQGQVMY